MYGEIIGIDILCGGAFFASQQCIEHLMLPSVKLEIVTITKALWQ